VSGVVRGRTVCSCVALLDDLHRGTQGSSEVQPGPYEDPELRLDAQFVQFSTKMWE